MPKIISCPLLGVSKLDTIINLLDNDETLRNEYINKGLSIKDKFSNIKLSNDFVNILEDFKKQEENKK